MSRKDKIKEKKAYMEECLRKEPKKKVEKAEKEEKLISIGKKKKKNSDD